MFMTKNTLNGTRHRRLSNVGFRVRIRTASGRRILRNRRNKGRKSITGI